MNRVKITMSTPFLTSFSLSLFLFCFCRGGIAFCPAEPSVDPSFQRALVSTQSSALYAAHTPQSPYQQPTSNRRDLLLQAPPASLFILTAPFLWGNPAAVAAAAPRMDVNNALAREYTAFPGLFPTIATKIVQNGPYQNKKEVYAVLNEMEQERLKQYDSSIIIQKPDAQLKQFKSSQICKYECGSRVSNEYRDEQIRQVQKARR